MPNYFCKFSIHHHFYLPRSADSHCFSLTQSPSRCFTYLWPQSRVCHYKVFQLSIQYSRRRILLNHLQPQKLYLKINLINPLRLLSSWHFTHLLCFNSVLRVYDLRPVPLCTLESLTSTGNLFIVIILLYQYVKDLFDSFLNTWFSIL